MYTFCKDKVVPVR